MSTDHPQGSRSDQHLRHGDDQHSPDQAPERLAYSVNEAARLTGLSRDLLYDQMRRGNLPYIKVGRRRLITRQHLQQFLGAAPLAEP
jgi:excisionase family DNA binding protein